MKDYYALLSVAADATTDDIKRAFRREIARYHPDKVHHLGQEFQALAAERAAELTEAYRVLMDEALRDSYDRERGGNGAASPQAQSQPQPQPQPPADRPRAAREADPDPPPPPADPPPRTRPQAPDTFVRRMAMTKFRDAIEKSLEGVTSMPARGFEASYLVKGKRTLFGKPVPERMLTAYVGHVTPEEVANLGHQALASRGAATAVTVFALGETLAPAAEISTAISSLRRKTPAGVTLSVVPVDVRDWTPLMPKDATPNARAVIAQLNARD